MTAIAVHPVDEKLPLPRLSALGLQHVLVMYAGAVAVPLIAGRALKLSPEQVVQLISADLFCCGLVTLIQSLGFTKWFGVKLPVMMGVTFASVGPMVAMANAVPGLDGARADRAPLGRGAEPVLQRQPGRCPGCDRRSQDGRGALMWFTAEAQRARRNAEERRENKSAEVNIASSSFSLRSLRLCGE